MIKITCPSDRSNSRGQPQLILLAFSTEALLPSHQSYVEEDVSKIEDYKVNERREVDFNSRKY